MELLVAAMEAQNEDAGASGQVLAVCLRSSLTAAFERHVVAAATEAADASGAALVAHGCTAEVRACFRMGVNATGCVAGVPAVTHRRAASCARVLADIVPALLPVGTLSGLQRL